MPNEKDFFYFSTNTFVVGTQKNRLNETPKTYFKIDREENINNFTLKNFVYINLCISNSLV